MDNKKYLQLESCEDYKAYLAGNDNSIQGSEKYIPKDAMSLKKLGKMTDAEIIGIINKMSVVPNKSDIRVMYANGYGFSWAKLQIIADFKGFVNTKPGSNSPHYTMAGIMEVVPDTSIESKSDVIYIEHGTRREGKLRKFTFTNETSELIDDLLAPLSNLEKSKVMEELIKTTLKEAYAKKTKNQLVVKYRPVEEERIL